MKLMNVGDEFKTQELKVEEKDVKALELTTYTGLYLHVEARSNIEEKIAEDIVMKTRSDATQQRNVCIVHGEPRSGKSQMARFSLNYYMNQALDWQLKPRRKSFLLNCSHLESSNPTFRSKLLDLFNSVFVPALSLPTFLDSATKEEDIKIAIQYVLRRFKNSVVTIDEYQMLFLHLQDPNDVLKMSSFIREMLLSENYDIQWIITGSSNASVLHALSTLPRNGVDVGKGAYNVVIPTQSSMAELKFVYDYYIKSPKTDEFPFNLIYQKIENQFGHVNCARLNLVLSGLITGQGGIDTVINNLLGRIYEIYSRDVLPLMRTNPNFFDHLNKLSKGVAISPGSNAGVWGSCTRIWRHDKEDKAYYVMDDPLFVAWFHQVVDFSNPEQPKITGPPTQLPRLSPPNLFTLGMLTPFGERLTKTVAPKDFERGVWGHWKVEKERLTEHKKDVFWKSLIALAAKLETDPHAKFGSQYGEDFSISSALTLTHHIFAHEPTPEQKYRYELFLAWEKFLGKGNIPAFTNALNLYFKKRDFPDW